jgi:hypothetical protein
MDGCRYVSLELTDAGKEGIIVFAARFYLKDSLTHCPLAHFISNSSPLRGAFIV